MHRRVVSNRLHRRSQSRWQRLATRRTLWLVFVGLMLTVVSSWASAIAFRPFRFDLVQLHTRELDSQQFRWPGPTPERWRQPHPLQDATPKKTWMAALGQLRIQTSRGEWQTGLASYTQFVWGFPLPAMHADEALFGATTVATANPNDASTLNRGWAIYGIFARPGASNEIATLPLVPWWPGFILNTIFWSLIAAWIARLFRFARWGKYLSRGQCPKCKYPIGAKPVCPECGVAVPGGLARPAGEVP